MPLYIALCVCVVTAAVAITASIRLRIKLRKKDQIIHRLKNRLAFSDAKYKATIRQTKMSPAQFEILNMMSLDEYERYRKNGGTLDRMSYYLATTECPTSP